MKLDDSDIDNNTDGQYLDLIDKLRSDGKKIDSSKDANSLQSKHIVTTGTSKDIQDNKGDKSSVYSSVDNAGLYVKNSPLDVISSLRSFNLSSSITNVVSYSTDKDKFDVIKNSNQIKDFDPYSTDKENIMNENFNKNSSSSHLQSHKEVENNSHYLHSSSMIQEENDGNDEEGVDTFKPLRNNWINDKHDITEENYYHNFKPKYSSRPLKTWLNEHQELSSSDDNDTTLSSKLHTDNLPTSNVADIIAKYIYPLKSTESKQSSKLKPPFDSNSSQHYHRNLLDSDSDSELSDTIAEHRREYSQNLSNCWSEYKNLQSKSHDSSELSYSVNNMPRYFDDFNRIINNPTKHILNSLMNNESVATHKAKKKHKRKDYRQRMDEVTDEYDEIRSSSIETASDIEKIVQRYTTGYFPVTNDPTRSKTDRSNYKSLPNERNIKSSNVKSNRNKKSQDSSDQYKYNEKSRSNAGNSIQRSHAWSQSDDVQDKSSEIYQDFNQASQPNSSAPLANNKVNKSISNDIN